MANDTTDSEPSFVKKDNSLVIAIILPSLFAIVLILLLAMAFILPKITGRDDPAAREERQKKRMARLENSVKAQHFVDWAAKQRDEHPDSVFMNPICVICLDEIEDASQIRGLGCLHVFHQECLDDWFVRSNEYCPLCHRPIIPGMKQVKKKPADTPPIAFMV